MQDNTPILVGSGQLTLRETEDLKGSLGPADVMEKVARLAAEDAGPSQKILESIDSLCVVLTLSADYPDLPGLLSERLGIHPKHKENSVVGGETPQYYVNTQAQALAEGRTDMVVMVGGSGGGCVNS